MLCVLFSQFGKFAEMVSFFRNDPVDGVIVFFSDELFCFMIVEDRIGFPLHGKGNGRQRVFSLGDNLVLGLFCENYLTVYIVTEVGDVFTVICFRGMPQSLFLRACPGIWLCA